MRSPIHARRPDRKGRVLGLAVVIARRLRSRVMDEPLPAATEERTDGPEQAGASSDASAPQSPELATEVALMAARPTALQRYVVEPFWAGLFACGLGVTLVGLIELLHRMHVLRPRPEALFIALVVLIPLVLAMARGFPTRTRGAKQLIGRIVGVLIFGFLSAFAFAGILLALFDVFDVRAKTSALVMTLGSAILSAVAYRVVQWRRARAERQTRELAAALGMTSDALTSAQASTTREQGTRRSMPEVVLAGIFGGGFGLWLLGVCVVFSREGLIESSVRDSWVFGVAFVAMLVALGVGFRSPVRSYASLLGRIVGLSVVGFVAALAVLFVTMSVAEASDASKQSGFFWASLASALLGALALYRQRALPEERRRRMALALVGGVVLFMPVWGYATRMRCFVGSSFACAIAATDLDSLAEARDSRELHERAMAHAERGCAHDSPVSCRIAGMGYMTERWGQPELAQAERFLRAGCALEDPISCERVHVVELLKRCDRNSPFACAELGMAYRQGQGVDRDRTQAQRFYRRACLLGDASACSMM